jgi:hypothetical protein
MAALLIAFLVAHLQVVSVPDAGFNVRKITLNLFHRLYKIFALNSPIKTPCIEKSRDVQNS